MGLRERDLRNEFYVCGDCLAVAPAAHCWLCNAAGCRQCIRPVKTEKGIYYTCEQCRDHAKTFIQSWKTTEQEMFLSWQETCYDR